MTHVLGDGDDYLLGVTLPSGESLSALVYVDHNLGTVVKDAFVVPEPLEDLAIKMGTLIDDADQSLTRTDPATARAVIEAAIDHGSPTCTRRSPRTAGRCAGRWWSGCCGCCRSAAMAPDWRSGREEETAAVAAEFFASPFGAPLIDEDEHRSLLESVLWFCTATRPGTRGGGAR